MAVVRMLRLPKSASCLGEILGKANRVLKRFSLPATANPVFGREKRNINYHTTTLRSYALKSKPLHEFTVI